MNDNEKYITEKQDNEEENSKLDFAGRPFSLGAMFQVINSLKIKAFKSFFKALIVFMKK